jgi:cytochrome c peroxidase
MTVVKNISAIFKLAMVIAFFTLIGSCKKESDDNNDDYNPTPYSVSYPSNFPLMSIPSNNPLTVEGIELGRRLYYDTKLSVNGPMQGSSCSSCHYQSNSFTVNSPGTAVLAHVNLAWANYFLWEGKIQGTLEDIMMFEVDEFFQSDLSAIKSDASYPTLYKSAFGTTEINSQRTAFALAQWFRKLTSANSKFDKFLLHEASLSADELNGFILFNSEKGDCFHCHTIPLMTDNMFHNIGLDSVFTGTNRGRNNFTGNSLDIGLFKTPTLRNIELTAPYMHDGRFVTLEEVVEHYNSGVKLSATLDPIMTKQGKEFGLLLTQKEKMDLVAFLKTLTDESYIVNSELSSPF